MTKAKVNHVAGYKGHARKKKAIGGYYYFCKQCRIQSEKIKTARRFDDNE